MYWLSPATALLTGYAMRLANHIALQTRVVGLALRERIAQTGRRFSAEITYLQPQSSPAQAASLKKQKAAKHTSVAAKSTSKKQSAVQMEKSQCSLGNSIQIPAHKTLQPASQALKQKQEAALFTQREQSHRQEQAPAQTHMDSQFGVRGKHKAVASKTNQPVSLESRAKRKPVDHIKVASKPTQGKAPVQTHTVRRHGVDGK